MIGDFDSVCVQLGYETSERRRKESREGRLDSLVVVAGGVRNGERFRPSSAVPSDLFTTTSCLQVTIDPLK